MLSYRIMLSVSPRFGRFLSLLCLPLVLAFTHCAPSREQVRAGAQAGSPAGEVKAPLIALGPKDLLHVAPVTMPGITTGAKRALVATPADSATAVSTNNSDTANAKGAQGASDTANTTASIATTSLPTTPADTAVAKAAQVAQATEAVLAAYGWDAERFASQLHAEIILRMRRQGIGTTSDSAAATAHLKMRITNCERDGGVKFAAEAALSKMGGARTVKLGGDSGKAYESMGGLGSAGQLNSPATSATEGAASQDMDPTLLRMQQFAKALADEIVIKPPAPPAKPKRKRRNADESVVPQVFMVF
jgi:hypothetical protein